MGKYMTTKKKKESENILQEYNKDKELADN